MAPSSTSPSSDVNYGPIVTDCDMSFITSTPTSCKYLNMDLVEDNFSLMARNNWSQDTATVDVSSSSSTLSAPSPTPISPSVDFVDLNFNSTMSTSTMENCNQTTNSSNLNFNIQEVVSIPPPDVFSSNPSSLSYSYMPNRNIFRQDVLDNHFDSQLSPAAAAISYNEQTQGISPINISSASSAQFYSSSSLSNSFATVTSSSVSVAGNGVPLKHSSYQNPLPPRISPQFMDVPEEKFVPPTFKTDLSKFCNRDPNRTVKIKVPQLGQNVIPIAKRRKPQDRLWYVDKNDSFKNIPVLKKPEVRLVHSFKRNPGAVKQDFTMLSFEPVIQKRGRGRPRGSGRKTMSKRDFLSSVVHPDRAVCARCFELLQQLR